MATVYDHEVHEEEKRAARVALEDDDEQEDAPHDEEGSRWEAECGTAPRSAVTESASPGWRQGEGREENNENLGQLASRLNEKLPNEPELLPFFSVPRPWQDERDHAHKPQRKNL